MTPAFFHREREGFALRVLLSPLDLFALIYRFAVHLRAGLYRAGLLARTRVDAPVVSVGNLVVGGAGKTPVVLFLAERLLARGRRVAVLSRGYGRRDRAERRVERDSTAEQVGDEPLLIARRCPGAKVYVGPRRDRLARRAIAEGADVLLLDDGFQYLALERDLDVVVIDGASPLGNGRLLPRGPLREPPSALARADLGWISKVDEGEAERVERADRLVRAQTGHGPVRSRYRIVGVVRGDLATPVPPAAWERAPVYLFAGLARPDSFRRTVERLGMRVVGMATFADHAFFGRRDIEKLFAQAARAGAHHLVCTEKDAVRLPAEVAADSRFLAVRIEVEIVEGAERLEAALDDLLTRGRAA